MEIIPLFAVAVLAAVVGLSAVDADKCDVPAANAVKDCLSSYKSEMVEGNLFEDRGNIGKKCSAMQKFKTCLESTGCQTVPAVVPIYEGFRNGLKFLCSNENMNNEKVESCWNSFGFKNAEIFCAKYVNNQTESECDRKNDVLGCMVKSVDKCCGPEAARYTSESLLAMLVPILKTMPCDLENRTGVAEIDRCGAYVSIPTNTPSSSSGTNAGVIVAVVVVVLLVICGVVVAVVVLIRRSRMAEWLRV